MLELIIKKGVKRTRVLMYNDIDQMPVNVFQLANKYWMLDDQLGSSFSDIEDKHLKKIAFVAKDEKRVLDSVAKMSSAINLILNETNVEALSFAALIYSVNDKEVTDRSEGSLKRLLSELSEAGLTMGLVKKKRSDRSFMKIWRYISPVSLRTQVVSEGGSTIKTDF